MKRWTSNRVKLAGIITKIDGYVLHVEGHHCSIEVNIGYLRKHRPEVGGYFIMYEDDGYESFCPADVFERSHQEADTYTASETQTETPLEPEPPEVMGAGTIDPDAEVPTLSDQADGTTQYQAETLRHEAVTISETDREVESVLQRDHAAERQALQGDTSETDES